MDYEIVSTIIKFTGQPPMRVSIATPPNQGFVVIGPYREPASFATYAAAVRCYTNIIDAILSPL